MSLGPHGTDRPRRPGRWLIVACAGVVTLVVVIASIALTGALDGFVPADAAAGHVGRQAPAHTVAERLALARRSLEAPTPRVEPAPLRVVHVSPGDGASDVSGGRNVVVRFSAGLAGESPHPGLSPSAPGHWTHPIPTTLVFHPRLPFSPDTTVTLRIPGGAAGMQAASGGLLRASEKFTWRTADGSTRRLQQVLAELGYLPLDFHPDGKVSDTKAAQTQSAYDPPDGSYAWRSGNVPDQLRSLWSPGHDGVMTRGAVMAFQHANGLTMDGVAGHDVWRTLIHDAVAHDTADKPYSWAWATKGSPEKLRIWRGGKFVFTTLANTGVAKAPTPDGTWPVYARFRKTTMSGTNPDGTHYKDPGVPYVNYFHGGDAIHGFTRAQYGYPQSVGCIEVPVSAAKHIWGLIDYGTLVTVTG